MNELPWWGIALIAVLVFLNGILFYAWLKRVVWSSLFSALASGLFVSAIIGGVYVFLDWQGLTGFFLMAFFAQLAHKLEYGHYYGDHPKT